MATLHFSFSFYYEKVDTFFLQKEYYCIFPIFYLWIISSSQHNFLIDTLFKVEYSYYNCHKKTVFFCLDASWSCIKCRSCLSTSFFGIFLELSIICWLPIYQNLGVFFFFKNRNKSLFTKDLYCDGFICNIVQIQIFKKFSTRVVFSNIKKMTSSANFVILLL